MTVSLLTSPRLFAVAACCCLPCAAFVFPHTVQAAHEQATSHGTEATTLETVVVTADRLSEFAEQNPAMVEVLGRKEMSRRNLLSVEEALGTMAGVEVKQSMGVGSRISIRGSGKSGGVLVLLNGRPLNSNQFGSVDLAGIPVETIESITVFKPPVPVWLGSGASEGAISIATKGITSKKEADKGPASKLRVAGGSYGTFESSASHQMRLASGATAMGSATGKHRDGKRSNSDLDSGSLLVHWDDELEENRKLEFNGRFFTSESGSPGPLDNPTPDARQSYDKASFDSRLSGLAGDSGDYALNLYGDTIRVEDKSQTGLVSTLDDDKVGLKGEYNWNDAADQWALRTSTILEHDDLDHTLSGSHQRSTAGIGVQTDRKWQDWTLTAGARGDEVSDFGFNPAVSGGIHHVLGVGWSFKANLGHSVNIPTFGQLYQPSHGSIDQTRGNPDLDKEKILAADAGVEYSPSKIASLRLSIFRSDTDDPILYQRDSTTHIYSPINGDKAWRQGVEAGGKYTVNPRLSLEANLILQDSEVEGTGAELTYTPHLTSKLTVQSTVPTSETRLETTLRYCGKQYSEMSNLESQRLDEYVTVDGKLTQPFKLMGTNAEWFVNVENLFDTGYSIHYGYPDEGIRLLTGLNLRF
ncbi:TonB-dependent receptor [Desulfobulbus propionicus DSM 2032]|uniref:TonB-dependent receptor n=1 Tax=Desulfobulbus propionicus (strain ATCC 33891 / DSM 2032 / VKM B-1956 / 1pr3) TaxID=577650 RepID=A0A7U3YPP4_DESPD|nr:TonB-dependent receptor [Desulfobulbus propionicus]ADW19259.1 TonB-dependent receptor [Desulfobulbus propionicus DSM 2032]